VAFLTSLPPSKEFRNQKLNYSIEAAHFCRLPGRFYEDQLGGLGDIASKKIENDIS